MPALLPGALEPSPDEARAWLSRELSRAVYHEQAALLPRLMEWLREQWQRLLDVSGDGHGLSPVVTTLVVAAVLALVALVLPRVRRERRHGAPGAVLADPTITAAMYRARLAAALAAGCYDDALADAYRAIARSATERTLLEDSPGRTAHEVALALAPQFPGERAALARAADLFDAVRYGHRHIARADAEEVAALDARLTRTRPTLARSVPELDADAPAVIATVPAPDDDAAAVIATVTGADDGTAAGAAARSGAGTGVEGAP